MEDDAKENDYGILVIDGCFMIFGRMVAYDSKRH
jgi:hypothetical protein